MTRLTIVVPCYNEAPVLHETTKRLLQVADTLAAKEVQTHILYVDDGSADETWQIIETESQTNSEVCGLKLAHNAGHQHALWAGLERACESADCIVTIDADLQDDVNAICTMVDRFLEGNDIVYGVRRDRSTDTCFKRQTAVFFYRFMHWLGTEVVYNHADFRLMSRRAAKTLLSYPERNLFLRGMVKSLGYRQATVEYDRAARFAGESKYPLSRMLGFAWDGITSFSVRPLRLILLLGVLFIVISFAVIIWALIAHFNGHTLPGWTSLLVSVWFVGGAILLALGIIGEYIGKIYSEVKRRPRYIVESFTGDME